MRPVIGTGDAVRTGGFRRSVGHRRARCCRGHRSCVGAAAAARGAGRPTARARRRPRRLRAAGDRADLGTRWPRRGPRSTTSARACSTRFPTSTSITSSCGSDRQPADLPSRLASRGARITRAISGTRWTELATPNHGAPARARPRCSTIPRSRRSRSRTGATRSRLPNDPHWTTKQSAYLSPLRLDRAWDISKGERRDGRGHRHGRRPRPSRSRRSVRRRVAT